MSSPGLAQIWSLDMPSAKDAPPPPNIDVWLVNNVLLSRVSTINLSSHLSEIPLSETRLRDEGFKPLYTYFYNNIIIAKSIAQKLGVAVPDFPDAPEDWNEELSTDYKTLAAQFRPHLAEPARSSMDWLFDLRDRDPKIHWTSRLADLSVSVEIFVQLMLAMPGMLTGSEWAPFLAPVASGELESIGRVFNEETLRIRADPESGWDEEDAKKVLMEQLESRKGLTKIGT